MAGDEQIKGFLAGAVFATFVMVMGRAIDVELTRSVTEQAVIRALVDADRQARQQQPEPRRGTVSDGWADDDDTESHVDMT